MRCHCPRPTGRRGVVALLAGGILAGVAPGHPARAQGADEAVPPMMPLPPTPGGGGGRRPGRGGGMPDWRMMLMEADAALRSGRRSVAGDRLERAETALLNLGQRTDRPGVQRALQIVGEARAALNRGDLAGASARIQPLVAPRRQGGGGAAGF